MTSSELQKIFSANLKAARVRAGLSQMKLAEKAHASANYIALIESGKSFPSLQMLENIATALDVSAVDSFDKKSLSFPVNEDLRKKLLEEICLVVNNAFDETMTASA